MTRLEAAGREESDNSLLLLDDDAPLRNRLGRALRERGFAPVLAESVAEALAAVRASPPAFAVLDMRLGDGSGLTVVDALRRARPGARIIMLTGYANVASTAASMKAMAVDYLAKPADADQVVNALRAVGKPPISRV